MKIQFDSELDYQLEAIEAVVDIFKGQEICQNKFTVSPLHATQNWMLPGMMQTEVGVGNRLDLQTDEILVNVRDIQLRNSLALSQVLDSYEFTIEMETGTGKTYVYLRTIFELNKRYGFTKFTIVVPSVAIKEGVFKNLSITEQHFRQLYDNTPIEYFVYDSQDLGRVRNFATSPCIQIMIINIDAFRKAQNIMNQIQDRMTGVKPISFIQSTRPIVIIDEPQSVDNTEKSKEAIASLTPLCTLRYSATHTQKHHMVYRLDSVDAYERKLVKQIEIAGYEVKEGHNTPYVKLVSVDRSKGRSIRATIELDVQMKSGVRRKPSTVKAGDDLRELSNNRELYEGYIIRDIVCKEGNEHLTFTTKPEIAYLGQPIGEIDADEFKRVQIRKTIEEHLDKELRLKPKGIKVLSLFFIDKVDNYRSYDDDGNPQKGKFALWFEEAYSDMISQAKYKPLLKGAGSGTRAHEVHDGYFAIDKQRDTSGKDKFKESSGGGTKQADDSAYQLIMRDKERLLSFDCKLKFIFSHSALREGWDNPNVFQICTLNETSSAIKKRQEIGRGLRIAVNQRGERVYGFDVNTLTVMANESYESFAEKLQKEIEEDERIRFGVVEDNLFTRARLVGTDGAKNTLSEVDSKKLVAHLKDKGYVDAKGKVQDTLRLDLSQGVVDLPEPYQLYRVDITQLLKRVAGSLNIKDAKLKRKVSVKRAILEGTEFQALWERIKYKTMFSVDFDSKELIQRCAKEINKQLEVGASRIDYKKSTMAIEHGGGVKMSAVKQSSLKYDIAHRSPPDVITYLQNKTDLTRRSIVEILIKSGRLSDFKVNPQQFIDKVAQIIESQMRLFIVEGIKYEKVGNEQYYVQELFDKDELYGYLTKNMLTSEKSVHDYIIYGSTIEEAFAKAFEDSEDVKVYAKLPRSFKIDTPLGTYSPDWAVLIEVDGEERLYLVVETKGSKQVEDRRLVEQAKIDCGKHHFKAMSSEVEFMVEKNYDTFLNSVLATHNTRRRRRNLPECAPRHRKPVKT